MTRALVIDALRVLCVVLIGTAALYVLAEFVGGLL